MYTTIGRGCTFHSSTGFERGEYYVPSGDHGARVASLICSICPNTTLYIAKLAHEFTHNERTQISTVAAAKAVKLAVQCGVDIINMSWTIDYNIVEDELRPLQEAIQGADSQGIVMFCSASDQGGSSKVCYPAKYSNTIAIGSLSAADTPSVWLQPPQVAFMFPGERIAVQHNDGTTIEDSGSSLATAVATGVGGLLMYCTLLLDLGTTSSMRTGDGGREFLWTNDLMRRVLTNISGETLSKERKLTRPEVIRDRLHERIGGKKHQILSSEQELGTKSNIGE